MMFRGLIALFIILCFISESYGFFGFGKKKEEKKKDEISAKDTVALGMDALYRSSQDPKILKEAMDSLKDPETMKEVEKMMKDPEFIKEMEKLKNDPQFVRSMLSAQDMYSDPQKAAKVMGQIKAQKAMEENEISDAQLGLSELAKAAKNPKMLAEAMEMLKDPEIAKEVEAMMADPAFKAEMSKLTESANFKNAMERAAGDIEMLAKDPIAMKRLKSKGQEL